MSSLIWDLHCLLKRCQHASADNKNIGLFVISVLRVNTCEVNEYTVGIFMKCTHVCTAKNFPSFANEIAEPRQATLIEFIFV